MDEEYDVIVLAVFSLLTTSRSTGPDHNKMFQSVLSNFFVFAALLQFLVTQQWLVYGEMVTCSGTVPMKYRNDAITITDFGGVGDGRTLNTKAFQEAIYRIEHLKRQGGTVLYIPQGVFLTGSFNLTSRMTLYLSKGVVIKATQVGNIGGREFTESLAPDVQKLLVKTMRALQYFPTIEDPNTRNHCFEVLQRVLMGTNVKTVNKNNASHAVLFEALALMDRYQRVEKPRAKTPINKNGIRITTQGRMRNYITYAPTLLQDKGSNEIVLKTMGRAINKNVMIAELIKSRIAGLHQNTSIGSTDITDMWERLWKKAKRIASQSDESCLPQAPRQDGLCGAALGFILSEAIVTNACYCIFEDSGLLGKSYRNL